MRASASAVILALVVVACDGGNLRPDNLADSSTPSPTPAATATIRPTPAPTPTPSPAPTDPPSLVVEVHSLTQRVRAGGNARLAVQTVRGADCDITVTYDSGSSEARGLRTKTANRRGRVNWTWTVGSNTARGTYDISVVCTKDDARGRLETQFRVR